MKATMMKALTTVALAALTASSALAQLPQPGSALIYPSIRNDTLSFQMVSVTNTASTPIADDILAYFNYVNAVPNPADQFRPLSCDHFCRAEFLTANDTVTVSVFCHSPWPETRGYMVLWPTDPLTGQRISHNYLVGSSSTIVLNTGAFYSLKAIPWCSPLPQGVPTDINGNGHLDFDGIEYEQMHCFLIADMFYSGTNNGLAVAEFSTLGPGAEISLAFDIFNDNEMAMSLHFGMQCFFEVELSQISTVFTQAFLASTMNDPDELDLNCDGIDDIETGWFRLRAVQASLAGAIQVNPPLIGAFVGGPWSCSDARCLHGSKERCDGRFK